MKAQLHSKFFLLSGVALLITACSPHQKEPVAELQNLREFAKTEVSKGPIKPQVVTETIVVEKPQVVVQEQAKLDATVIVVDLTPVMSFTEGVKGQYTVRVRHLIPDLTTSAIALDLPKDSKLIKAESLTNEDIYTLEWTPPSYYVGSDRLYEQQQIDVKVVSTSTHPALKNLTVSKKAVILVTKQQQAPIDLKTINLGESLSAGAIHNFSIQVKVPGYDNNSEKRPQLILSPDPMSYTPGLAKEWDASRHILPSSSSSAKYIGDNIWQFDLALDLKNIALQSDTLPANLRMLAKVYSPNGLSTSSQLIRFTTVKGDQ